MVAAFKDVMEISTAQASLVQFAFYGGYATMAIPAALFIRRSATGGILLRPGAVCGRCLPFIQRQCSRVLPFSVYRSMAFTFGLAFLETTAKILYPFAGRQGNIDAPADMAQAFNPVGSLSGMAIASFVVLPNLLPMRDSAGNLVFNTLDASEKAAIRTHDLAVIRDPYVAIGLVVLVMFVIIALVRMPRTDQRGERLMQARHLRHLWHNHPYG